MHYHGVKLFEDAYRRQLQRAPKRSGDLRTGRLRRAAATTLIAWARRLAPELPAPVQLAAAPPSSSPDRAGTTQAGPSTLAGAA